MTVKFNILLFLMIISLSNLAVMEVVRKANYIKKFISHRLC